MLAEAAEAGCQIVDLEVESAEEAKPAQLARVPRQRCGRRARRCWSARTTSPAPEGWKAWSRRPSALRPLQPDFVKVVSTARSLADNLAVLKLIEDRSLTAHVVGIAMGEEGLVSRVLGPRAGAAFTFASLR